MTADADPPVVDESFNIGPGKSETIVFGGMGQATPAEGCNSLRVNVKVKVTWNALPIGMPVPIEVKYFKGSGTLITSKTSSTSPLTTNSTTIDSTFGRTRLVIKNTGTAATAVALRVTLVGSVATN